MSWVDLMWLTPMLLCALAVLVLIAWIVMSTIAYAMSARAKDKIEERW